MLYTRRMALFGSLATLTACRFQPNITNKEITNDLTRNYVNGGVIEPHSALLDQVIDPESAIEVIGSGFKWVEGPAWHRQNKLLYFSDVSDNVIYSWSEQQGLKVFQNPGGIAQSDDPDKIRLGSNGLWPLPNGDLIVCNHGARSIEYLDPQNGQRREIVSSFNGKRLNSPNDVVAAKDGTIYFTDPVSGLEGGNQSALKELAHNGVYRVDNKGRISLLLDDMIFPNGVTLSADERYLYIAQSKPSDAYIRRVELLPDGSVGEDIIWFDARPFYQEGVVGNPDGMAVTTSGHMAVTGPGGVFILASNGELLGRIKTNWFSSNCCFGEDGKTLFITADDYLLRVKTKLTGIQWA